MSAHELQSLSFNQLKNLADEFGVGYKGLDKPKLLNKLLLSAEAVL